jgi:hypothetical protein
VQSGGRGDGRGDLSEIRVVVRLGRLGFLHLCKRLSSLPEEPSSCLVVLPAGAILRRTSWFAVLPWPRAFLLSCCIVLVSVLAACGLPAIGDGAVCAYVCA